MRRSDRGFEGLMTPQKLLPVTLHHLQIDLVLSFKYLAVISTKLRGGKKKKDFVFSSVKTNPLFFYYNRSDGFFCVSALRAATSVQFIHKSPAFPAASDPQRLRGSCVFTSW